MKRLMLIAAAILTMGAGQMAMGPAEETAFAAILASYREKYIAAPNDMVRGGLRAERSNIICGPKGITMKTTEGGTKNWMGTVETLSSTNQGYGVLKVRISDHATVTTAFTETYEQGSTEKTLIMPGSAVFKAAANLKVGDKVVFSGHFFPKRTDCALEKSLSQAGSMTDPDFLFAFTDLHAAE